MKAKILLLSFFSAVMMFVVSCNPTKSDFGPFESQVDKRIDVLTMMLTLKTGETAIRQTKFAIEKILNSRSDVCEVTYKEGTPVLFLATKTQGVCTITVFDKAGEPRVVYRLEAY